MAALPVSPDSLYSIASFAHEVWQSCRGAKGQFDKIGREAFALKSVVELVAIELEDKQLPVNALDDDARTRTYYRQLGIHIGNCQQALQTAQNFVRKHEKTAAWQQLRWGRSGKEDIDCVVADLVSFATQLDSFVGALNFKSIGKMLGRIGRLEQVLDQNGGNESEAVSDILADVVDLGMPAQAFEKYKTVLATYAQELNQQARECPSPTKKKKSDSIRDRKKSDSPVTATANIRLKERSQSADTIHSTSTMDLKRSQSATPSTKTLLTTTTTATSNTITTPKPALECYLIQIKSNNFAFLTWQKSGKELQPRGQPQLEEMARTFRAATVAAATSSKSSKTLADEYDLVGWVVEDRQKSESDPQTHEWRPYASRIERKAGTTNTTIGSGAHPGPLLDQGVEEQALVIVERGLTASAARNATSALKAAQAVLDADRKRAKVDAAELKKQAKLALLRRKSEDAAAEKAEREKREQGKRMAEMRHLKQQVLMLGLNQQPTLADKPEAIAEKKRAEKRAREKATQEKIKEMEDRRVNLKKVELALFPLDERPRSAEGKGKEVERSYDDDERWLGGSPHLRQEHYSPHLRQEQYSPSAFGGCREEGRIQVSGKMFGT